MPRETTLDAWCQGYAAGRAGMPADQNPYLGQGILAGAWERAWHRSQSPEHASLQYGRA